MRNRGVADLLLVFLLTFIGITLLLLFFSTDIFNEINILPGIRNTIQDQEKVELIKPSKEDITKKVWFEIPEDQKIQRLVYTNDLENYAYINHINSENKNVDDDILELIYNGRSLGKYDRVLDIQFADGQLIYHAINYLTSPYVQTQEGAYEKSYLSTVFDDDMALYILDISDGERKKITNVLNFNKRGSTLAYVKADTSSEKLSAYIDNEQVSESYDNISTIDLSPNGEYYTYVGTIYDQNITEVQRVLNGESISNDAEDITLEDEGWYYLIERDRGWYLVTTNEEFGPIDSGLGKPNITYSFDQEKLIDLQEIVSSAVEAQDAIFSEDYSQWAARSGQKGDSYILLNGRELNHYHMVWDPRFSPDGKTFSYRASKNSNNEFPSNRQVVVVVNEEESPEYNAAQPPYFCSDSKKHAYRAFYYIREEENPRNTMTKVTYNVNGLVYDRFDNIFGGFFEQDCGKHHFIAEDKNEIIIVSTSLQ